MRRTGAAARTRVARTILDEARRAAVDPLLVVALIHVESSFDPHAVSPAGAVGLMQLLVPTMTAEAARWRLGSSDPLDAPANVQAGVRYLARLVDAFGDLDLALMAYNAGPNRIRGHLRAGGVPGRFRAYPTQVAREVARLRAASLDGASPRLACARSGRRLRDAPARERAGGTLRPGPASAERPLALAAVPGGRRWRDGRQGARAPLRRRRTRRRPARATPLAAASAPRRGGPDGSSPWRTPWSPRTLGSSCALRRRASSSPSWPRPPSRAAAPGPRRRSGSSSPTSARRPPRSSSSRSRTVASRASGSP
jgi:hypothetical protein